MKLKGNIENIAYQTLDSAGVDLRSRKDIVLPPEPTSYVLYNAFHFLLQSQSLAEFQGVFRNWLELEPPQDNVIIVPTGLYIDESTVSLEHVFITPRSSLAGKHKITVLNTPGLVDSDYPGEIGVIMINFGMKPFEIKEGDRIAQMVLMNHLKFDNVPVKEKIREGGFGSTGVK